jgi:predicted LPLAT superfamily acyltransferase
VSVRGQQARARDSVRVSVACKLVLFGVAQLDKLADLLGRLETRVVLVDVQVDLQAARGHLAKLAGELERIERALKEPVA